MSMTFSEWLFLPITQRLDLIMADLSNLQAAADQIQTDVNEAIEALNDLAAKVAAGEAQQADVDAITDTLTQAGQNLDAAREADNPPPTTP